jgi:hypothetical protein
VAWRRYSRYTLAPSSPPSVGRLRSPSSRPFYFIFYFFPQNTPPANLTHTTVWLFPFKSLFIEGGCKFSRAVRLLTWALPSICTIMSSLKFIMDVDEDMNKNDEASTTTGPSHGRDFSASDQANPGDHHDRLISTPATTKRRGASGRHSNHKSSAVAAQIPSSTTSTIRTAPAPAPALGPGTTSNEEMDRGYGGHGPSSGSGGMNPSNTPMRPMPVTPSGGDLPIKLTPITGRVSRAKKGVPVHTCEICRPAKVSLQLLGTTVTRAVANGED